MEVLVLNAQGEYLAQGSHPQEISLCVDRVWEEGDRMEIQADPGSHVAFRLVGAVLESRVYLPQGRMTWRVPFGEHRRGYQDGVFEGKRQVVTARLLEAAELEGEYDLARNPADLRGDTDFYPHCTANVETRDESVFAARNVIDGLRLNTYHGEWPFESWGIGAREDAWCKIDFGREVIVNRMALTLRADFPHDAYWVAGHVVTSDGAEIAYSLEKTGERQWIDLGDRKVSWLRLERMQKSDDPSAFPSLRSWEVFGTEAGE
ncbi:MAG: carbohydrate-binding protein [Clostridia bacterium]|nr:carbohydrate-binding protein [Clostridia bacterium]